jgi:drug/metabolite transporter (DMT)-like permease
MNTPRGIAFKLISAALFAVMSALIRHLGARYPVGQVVFYRSVFALFRSCLSTLGGANSPPSCAPSGRSARRAGAF